MLFGGASAATASSSATSPGSRADGAHRDRALATFDYADLIAELTGALPDPGVEGRSLKRLLCGVESTWRTDILNGHWNGVIPSNAQVRGVFDPRTSNCVEYVTGETELYDLDTPRG